MLAISLFYCNQDNELYNIDIIREILLQESNQECFMYICGKTSNSTTKIQIIVLTDIVQMHKVNSTIMTIGNKYLTYTTKQVYTTSIFY